MSVERHNPADNEPPRAPVSWERLDPATAAKELASDIAEGLSTEEAEARRRQFGDNVLAERGGRSAWLLLRDQFASTLIMVLLAAAGLSAAMGNAKDAIAIVTIVVLNALLGFVQEARAERAMAALRKLSVPSVRVIRSTAVVEVPSSELVPGDLVVLEAGNRVPADGRIVESASLRVQEAILTGESEAVEKSSLAIPGQGALALGDQLNRAFLGTNVVHGRGKMLVTGIGMATELGRIADLLHEVGAPTTPLQRNLNRLGRVLSIAALSITAAIFAVGILIGEDWRLMFMVSVSMAVAVIPEGLPAVVTIALALGAQRMLRRRALIRRLPAVETLGAVTVICSDKTGTLTENRMTVTVLDLAGRRLEVPETAKRGLVVTEVDDAQPAPVAKEEPSLALLLIGGALCNDAALQHSTATPKRFGALGDPTESALVVAAARFGFLKDELEASFPRIGEMPFDSDRKRMSTLHRVADSARYADVLGHQTSEDAIVFTKGAVDSLVQVCSSVWDRGEQKPIDEGWRERIARANADLAGIGMRVLGVAFRFASSSHAQARSQNEIEQDLVFVGLIGMLDPPRPEVTRAIAICREASIRPVMITGDHPVTARRIAQDLDILREGRVVTGPELQALSNDELLRTVDETSVYARVAPEQKLRIVEALQARGHVVAMTGDGVNDAPALRRADIGVAMGITGTDVSKEAASMVLLDDNFTTIVAAVEEGRAINDNVRRFLAFSLAGNIGKLVLVFVGPLLGMPLPLLPFQVLWLNLVTDGLLGLGIGVEPAERGTMQRPPHRPTEGLLSRGLGLQILWQGVLLGAANLAVALWAWRTAQPEWRTVIMTAVVLLQVFQAQAGRSTETSVFRIDPWSNRPLLAATGLVLTLQATVILVPQLQTVFGTARLSLFQVLAPTAAGLFVLIAVETVKWVRRLGTAQPSNMG